MKSLFFKLVSLSALLCASAIALVALVLGAYYYVEPGLPDAAEMRNVEMSVPLTIYTRDDLLINQYGGQKRTPVKFEDVPQVLEDAFLAAEDDSFREHPGIDLAGIARSAFRYLVVRDDRVPGASTITQQVAREYFDELDYRDYSIARKFKEWILAIRIEREIDDKDKILEIFLNTTFLGQRSFGVAAAAQTYFDKSLDELTIADAALLAGIPQAPSDLNPVADPEAARRRRGYVLGRLLELGKITRAEYDEASAVPVYPNEFGPRTQVAAPYVAEMIDEWMRREFGASARTAGLRVTTTIDSRLQAAANRANYDGLMAYEERHGYRGPVEQIALPGASDGENGANPAGGSADALDDETLEALLAPFPPRAGMLTALVLSAAEAQAQVYVSSRGRLPLGFESVSWAKRFITVNRFGTPPETVDEVLAPGDVIRLRTLEDGSLRLAQLPDTVRGAIVAVDPQDGAVVAMAGGFDFALFPYNTAVQARRQPGSAMKAFTYSAALANGFTLASMINDAPITEATDFGEWRPGNYGGSAHGPTPLRIAFEESYNLSAIRVVRDAGLQNVLRHVDRFGFDGTAVPRDLGLSLGAGGIAPVDLAAGYAVFANGGFQVAPYYIERVEDLDGNVIWEANPDVACLSCALEAEALRAASVRPAVRTISGAEGLVDDIFELYPSIAQAEPIISPQNAYLMTSLMRGVITSGTGTHALRLGRRDVVGKTGTTNDLRDAWFAGSSPDLVTVVWVGQDDYSPLGDREQGALTALPAWTQFMGEALEGVPVRDPIRPPGIVEVRINPATGLRACDTSRNTRIEIFEEGTVPPQERCTAPTSSTREPLDTPSGERRDPEERIF